MLEKKMGISVEEYKSLILREAGGKLKNVQRQLQGKINRGLGQSLRNKLKQYVRFTN